jgi:hypothetical protein
LGRLGLARSSKRASAEVYLSPESTTWKSPDHCPKCANANFRAYTTLVSVSAGSGLESPYISHECPADSLRIRRHPFSDLVVRLVHAIVRAAVDDEGSLASCFGRIHLARSFQCARDLDTEVAQYWRARLCRVW